MRTDTGREADFAACVRAPLCRVNTVQSAPAESRAIWMASGVLWSSVAFKSSSRSIRAISYRDNVRIVYEWNSIGRSQGGCITAPMQIAYRYLRQPHEADSPQLQDCYIKSSAGRRRRDDRNRCRSNGQVFTLATTRGDAVDAKRTMHARLNGVYGVCNWKNLRNRKKLLIEKTTHRSMRCNRCRPTGCHGMLASA